MRLTIFLATMKDRSKQDSEVTMKSNLRGLSLTSSPNYCANMLPTLANCAKAVYTAAPSNPHRFKRAGRGLFAGKLKLFGAWRIGHGREYGILITTVQL